MGLQVLSDDLRKVGANRSILATVETLEQASDVAVNILNDLLLYDKLDSGLLKLDIQEIPLISFVTEIMEPFQLQVWIGDDVCIVSLSHCWGVYVFF